MKANVRFSSPVTKENLTYATAVRFLCSAAIAVNMAHLKRFPTPMLYRSGVRWVNEPLGFVDEMVDVPTIIRRGWGDCWHVACWRVAELRLLGEQATIRVTGRTKDNKFRIFHVLVRRGNGAIEDPSLILGMGRDEI